MKQFIKEVRVGRDYNIEIVLNVPLDEFEEFKRHAASAGWGKKQKNKSQNPQKVGRCTSNAGIVVLDKTGCNSHGVQMYRIPIQNKIRYNVKAQLPLLMNGSCAFYI